jgi:N-acetylglutamate synthase-like GNAT family acetyltransferase
MDSPALQTRRATLDDLAALRRLWQAEHLPALQLDKRFVDFQVAQAADGRLLGALALQVDGLHGRIYGEAFADFSQAEALRPLLWERIQTVARNRGLVRLWTLEAVPFWRERGFDTAKDDLREKLPPAFGDKQAAWLTLKLKEELLAGLTPEQEFALFKDAAKAESNEMMRQARVLKGIAAVVAVIFLILVIVGGIYLVRYQRLKDQGLLAPAPKAAAPQATPATKTNLAPPAPKK